MTVDGAVVASATAGARLSPRARSWLGLAAVVCLLDAVCALVIYVLHFSKFPFEDWMVYRTAARAWLDGNLPLIYDGDRFTAQINIEFARWLPQTLSFHPFLYPPSYLLLLAPFVLLPFPGDCIAFLAVSLLCVLAAVWYVSGGGYRRWLQVASLLLAPAASFNVGSGQNAFLSAALLIGGFGLLPERPIAAGLLLGLLTYKPQLWLLVPVALVMSRRWRALACTIATGGLTVLISAALMGIEPWRQWVEWFLAAPPDIYKTWIEEGRLHGESVYSVLVLSGVSHTPATAVQGVATVVGVFCVGWCYSRPMRRAPQLAVLLAAAILAAPHVTNYDTVFLAVAATLVFVDGLDSGFHRGGVVIPVLVWGIQLFDPPDVFRLGLVTPVFTMLLIAYAMVWGRNDAGPVYGAGLRPIGAQ